MKGSKVCIFSVICHNLNLSVGLASCTEFNLLLLQLFHYGKQKESKNRIEIFIEQTQQNRFLQLPFSLTRHIFSFLSAYKLATGAFRVCKALRSKTAGCLQCRKSRAGTLLAQP